MSDSKVIQEAPTTEEELANSFWWWRHCRLAAAPVQLMTDSSPNHQESRDWQDGMEQIAQEWELIRRIKPDSNWPPFYDLNGFVAHNLRARLITRRHLWVKKMTTEISPVGWTDRDEEGWVWNLNCTRDRLQRTYKTRFLPTEQEISAVFSGRLTIDQLVAQRNERRKTYPSTAQFLKWIDAQAKSKGIQLPRGLKNQRNRNISWTWVEILDIAKHVATRRNSLRKLSPAERKMKTLATNTAKRLLLEYIKALSEISELPGNPWGEPPEMIARRRWIILGRWRPRLISNISNLLPSRALL